MKKRAKRPTKPPEAEDLAAPRPPAAELPTSGRSTLSVGAWQIYGFVGAALLFAPIYLVMKGFETYVDIPACEQTCEAHGYTYESLVTGKSTYNCHCTSTEGRRTFHERARIGGGTGALSAIADWFVRVATVLFVLGAWLALLAGAVRFLGRRSPDGVAANALRAVTGFAGKAERAAAPLPPAPPPKVNSRRRRRRG